MSTLFDFSDYGALLALVSNSLIAGALLGLVGGLIGFFVMARDLPFAVHGISELSFAGAAGALLIGADVVTGSIVGSLIAALLIGLLGTRARERNSVIGVLMPFGLGLGILFLSLYPGRSATASACSPARWCPSTPLRSSRSPSSRVSSWSRCC